MNGDIRYFRVRPDDSGDAATRDAAQPDNARAHSSATSHVRDDSQATYGETQVDANAFVSKLRTQRLEREAMTAAAANVNPDVNEGQRGVEPWMKQLGIHKFVAGLHKDEMAASYKISKSESDSLLRDLCDVSKQLLQETYQSTQLGPEQRLTDP